ncbi:MAG: right-handed parallel beta-helix repeat-containing protein [Bacteroidales bacterium]|nr:right-handed parallel beta-helix repeat-containing protein [Bacteroidales bacterium]
MRNLRSIFIIAFSFISLSLLASNIEVYVSEDGSSFNDGSKKRPLKSIEEALQKIKETRNNDLSIKGEIIFLAGEYYLDKTIVLTPEESNIIFKADKKENVKIYGGRKVKNWQRVDSNIWKAFIPEAANYGQIFEQLYVDKKRAVRARTPNSGFFMVDGSKEQQIIKGGTYAKLAIDRYNVNKECLKELNKVSSFEDNQNVMAFFYHKWDYTRKYILDFDNDSSCFYTYGSGFKPWNPIVKGNRFFLENYMEALDCQNEWYLDKDGWLYYFANENQDMNQTEAFYPVLNYFIEIKGDKENNKPVQEISFRDLSFEYSAYQTPIRGNETLQAAVHIDATIMIDFSKNISFNNCEVSHTGRYAFWFRDNCIDCNVEHCYLSDLGAGGVKIGEYRSDITEDNSTKNITVNNSIITQCSRLFPSAVGVCIFHSSYNNITHNEISDLGYSGVSVGWVWGYDKSMAHHNKIEFNNIHHIGWGELCDMGAVYTLGVSPGTTVSNNVVHHVYSYDYGGWGLYTDEGSTDITMENNLVYACKNAGFHQHYGKDNIIRNNIFALNLRSQLQATRIEEHNSFTFANNIIVSNNKEILSSNWQNVKMQSNSNCYWTENNEITFAGKSLNDYKRSYSKDNNSIIENPLFVDSEHFDFHFKSEKTVKEIGFVPFDYNKAGVYGDKKWKEKAKMPKDRLELFDYIVRERENKE